MKSIDIILQAKSLSANSNSMRLTFASDYFKCESCGYTVRMLVRGDTAHCSQCGGIMHRC